MGEQAPREFVDLTKRELRVPRDLQAGLAELLGAGSSTSSLLEVVSDLLGLFTDFVPKHAKQYARLCDAIKGAVADYVGEVKAGSFPTSKHSFTMDESVITELARSS